MSHPRLILASASPRRSELLQQMGIEFVTIPGTVKEVAPAHFSPHETAQINAYRKARAVAKKHPDELVLGADTIVCLGQRIFGKPATLAEAEQMLLALQGRSHEVVTGVCLVHWRKRRQRLFAVSTAVTFHPLDQQAIQRYLARVDPLDKAGAYAIQEHGSLIVREVSGSFSNVVGLPVERVQEELGFIDRMA
jgi:nucleoside triphosphate pyrophosphatase